jgi:hypothetical protein
VSNNGNGGLPAIQTAMKPILNYIDNDRFKVDYFTSSNPILGQFASQENPGFFFTGNLQ